MRGPILSVLALAALGALGWAIADRLRALDASAAGGPPAAPPAPVAVRPAERGPITLQRTFSGTLEASSEFLAAPKLAGRVERVLVDLGDPVQRGQAVARLDDAELVQAVHQAEADLAVARARLAAAGSAQELAARKLKRTEDLRADGVASESELDAARTQELAARTDVDLAEAGVPRAEAALETARIRLGYARVTADWNEGDDRRVVASRLVDEGETVSANAALLSVVELDPILAVLHAPERDYARLVPGQTARLVTDAHPGRVFEARVARIAPVFRRATRQARVELLVPNTEELLKPGMFVRATIELERVEDATIVPYDALTERGEETGLFVLDATGERALWRPVTLGVRDGGRIAVEGLELPEERELVVVVLGQELCDDGAPVTVAEGAAPGRP